jgi:hypothetical protein
MKKMRNKIYFGVVSVTLFLFVFGATTIFAQSTAFTYQGRLSDNNLSANGNYDFEFKLFTALTGGTQDGTSRQVMNVPVTNGTFTVLIDFGAGAFPGADRFLEIAVKPAGSGSFTTLSPRQQVTMTPYAIKSASADQASFAINANNAQNAVNAQTAQTAQTATNATNATNAINATNATNATTAQNALQLGGVAANQYVQTSDPRLSDARNPLPNSTNYIQNRTTQQTSTNFNISGNGTVGGTLTGNIVSAATQFNIGNNRILGNAGASNLFAGVLAGNSNTTGISNSFFGQNSGGANTSGSRNSFFGNFAGAANTTGEGNVFIGSSAGNTNAAGNNNSIISYLADVSLGNLTNATAIGSRAFVESSNTIVLGSVQGKNGATSGVSVGIGITNPVVPLEIEGELDRPNIRVTNWGRYSVISGRSSEGTRNNPTASLADRPMFIIGGDGYTGSALTSNSAAMITFRTAENWSLTANGTAITFHTTTNGSTGKFERMRIDNNGNVGIGTTSPVQKLDVSGDVRIGTGTNGCVEDRNGTVIAGACSSDLRFKKNITPFGNVLNNFSKLRPVNFSWRVGEFPNKYFGDNQSFGLIAQEVEQAFPDLVSTDEQGYKVVNYSKLPLLTIQAVKELKSENDSLKQQVEEQKKQALIQQQNLQAQIDELKKTLSLIQPKISVSKSQTAKAKQTKKKQIRRK